MVGLRLGIVSTETRSNSPIACGNSAFRKNISKYSRPTCGVAAKAWVADWAGDRTVLNLPHPSYLYRWGDQKANIPAVERDLGQFVATFVSNRGPRLSVKWDPFEVTCEIGEYSRGYSKQEPQPIATD